MLGSGLLVVSFVASVLTIGLFVQVQYERRSPSWYVVCKRVRCLIQQLNDDGYQPDMIVGIGRGGAIVGGMLAGNLGHVPLFVLDTIVDHSNHERSARLRYPGLCPHLLHLRILLVVGELYTGEDLRVAKHFIEEKAPAELRTLSLYSHPASTIRPDYVGGESKRPLTAPWRLTDVYRNTRV